MALSAVSSLGSDYLQLFRSQRSGRERPAESLARVQEIAQIEGREDAEASDGSEGEGRGKASLVSGRPVVDPRRPESILAEKSAERAAVGEAAEKRAAEQRSSAGKNAGRPSERDIRSRLEELYGEKSSIERRQAEEKGQRSAEVVSQLAQLKSRDSQVRSHEAAHMATGGRYITGGASYSYQKGPDGAQYAVGGEVGIDTSPVAGRPEETAQKMRTVRAAALAPSDPSAADLSVAAAASEMEAAALAEAASARMEETAAPAAAGGRDSERATKAQDAERPFPPELAKRYADEGGAPGSAADESRRSRVDMVA
jgi:hypothetical protein